MQLTCQNDDGPQVNALFGSADCRQDLLLTCENDDSDDASEPISVVDGIAATTQQHLAPADILDEVTGLLYVTDGVTPLVTDNANASAGQPSTSSNQTVLDCDIDDNAAGAQCKRKRKEADWLHNKQGRSLSGARGGAKPPPMNPQRF